jgi:AraC family transcriptional regulator of adaptative response / DNA-3-methyladenine glycosylase II
MKPTYSKTEFYRAHLARDPRFDGKFFVAVKTTHIYCRPICPARKAKLENLEFFLHKAQAEEAGYRPCLRCRPETAPDSSAWLGTFGTVQRALRMMDAFALEELTINSLAVKLGIGERWLRELFQQQVGVNPQTVLLSKKLDTARSLLDTSALSITDIAFSSGFQSIRRFNDAFKVRFQRTPSELRIVPAMGKELRLQLSYRPPYAWDDIVRFFSRRPILGVEMVVDNTYQRLIRYGDVCGWFKASNTSDNKIEVEFKLNKNANLLEFVARLKNIFDLEADPLAIEKGLREDEKLRPFLKQYAGLRVPGCWDGFELAVRAIVGQRISVKAAGTLLGRMVEICGEEQTLDPALPLKRFFPTPEAILAADLSKIGLTAARVASLKAMAQLVVDKQLMLDGTADFAETCQKLHAIPGVGAWTVEYIALRALHNPDAFPETDLEIQKKITRLQLHPQRWSPWRAYAAVLLWHIKTEDVA